MVYCLVKRKINRISLSRVIEESINQFMQAKGYEKINDNYRTDLVPCHISGRVSLNIVLKFLLTINHNEL